MKSARSHWQVEAIRNNLQLILASRTACERSAQRSEHELELGDSDHRPRHQHAAWPDVSPYKQAIVILNSSICTRRIAFFRNLSPPVDLPAGPRCISNAFSNMTQVRCLFIQHSTIVSFRYLPMLCNCLDTHTRCCELVAKRLFGVLGTPGLACCSC